MLLPQTSFLCAWTFSRKQRKVFQKSFACVMCWKSYTRRTNYSRLKTKIVSSRGKLFLVFSLQLFFFVRTNCCPDGNYFVRKLKDALPFPLLCFCVYLLSVDFCSVVVIDDPFLTKTVFSPHHTRKAFLENFSLFSWKCSCTQKWYSWQQNQHNFYFNQKLCWKSKETKLSPGNICFVFWVQT